MIRQQSFSHHVVSDPELDPSHNEVKSTEGQSEREEESVACHRAELRPQAHLVHISTLSSLLPKFVLVVM